MSEFLVNFMHAARAITQAERGMALDTDLNILERVNVDDSLLDNKTFSDLVFLCAERALEEQKAFMTNNMNTPPPETNIHLTNLRMVAAIPLAGYGVVYLDLAVRDGVFQRETLDKLYDLGAKVISNRQTDLNEKDLEKLFNELA